MGSIFKRLGSFLAIVFFTTSGLSQMTSDIEFDDVIILGTTPPYEFCQGTIPAFEIQMGLVAGSVTLTLNATSTLEFTAIGSGSNSFTLTITNVINLVGGNVINTGPNSNQYRWPTAGPNAIQLINPGVTDIIFKFSIKIFKGLLFPQDRVEDNPIKIMAGIIIGITTEL